MTPDRDSRPDALPLQRVCPVVAALAAAAVGAILLIAGSASGRAATPEPVARKAGFAENPFGVFFRRPAEFQEHKQPLEAAVELGASSVRLAETVSTWKGEPCPLCDAYRSRGLAIVLTVTAEPQRDNPDPGGPAQLGSRLPANLAAYKQKLGQIIDSHRPAIIAVENEQDGRIFWDDTPEHYLELLSAACEVAHAKGIECTDGGMSSGTVQVMVHEHYVAAGEPAKAESYRSRLRNYWTVPGDPDQRQARAEEGWNYLRNYGANGADYANFHWYEHDPSLYDGAAPYLASEARLPLLSNETGQVDELGTTTEGTMNAALRAGVQPVIWFSMDWSGRTNLARSLLNPDGTLRDSGRAYQRITSALVEPSRTKITRGPRGKVDPRKRVRFRFELRAGTASQFECKLKRPRASHGPAHARPKGFRSCASPKSYKRIKRAGRYTFKVRAVSASGEAERPPAKRVFRVAKR